MKSPVKTIATFLLITFCSVLHGQRPVIIDNNCTDYTQIPDSWITSAKNRLHIYYGHTSHGSQLTSGGMTALVNHYGNKYAFGTGANDGSMLYLNDVYDGMDITKENWVQPTRTYLAANTNCNVVMWSWCSFSKDEDHVNAYIDSMEVLIADYPDVNFVFFTGHNDDGNTEAIVRNRKIILDHCIANNRILFDFTALEAYDPDGNFFGDWSTNTNLLLGVNERHNLDENTAYNMEGASTPAGNWGLEWQSANTGSTLDELAQSDVCTSCSHSSDSRLHCVLKGAAVWWMAAVIAGWDDSGSNVGGSTPNSVDDKIHATFGIYPNPSSNGILTVFNPNGNANIGVYNILGNKVATFETTHSKTVIDLSDKPTGVYYFITQSGMLKQTERVIIR